MNVLLQGPKEKLAVKCANVDQVRDLSNALNSLTGKSDNQKLQSLKSCDGTVLLIPLLEFVTNNL